MAGWFEQCHFEAYRVVTAEGAPCHSFCMLAHGTAEAIESAGYHPEPIEATDGGRGGAFLEAGAYWGDAAFGGGGLPLGCSVRALTPCVVLVLRHHRLEQELPSLPTL